MLLAPWQTRAMPFAPPTTDPALNILTNPGPDTGLDIGTRAGLAAAVMAEARRQGVPPALADAVATIETGYNPWATGSSGEIGLMQILPATARSLGFRGVPADLFDATTNIHFAVAYLARSWAASGGNVCRALMKYRAGLGQDGYSALSLQYCGRAMAYLTRTNADLARGPGATMPAGVTMPDPFAIAIGPALTASFYHRPYHGPWRPPALGYQYHRSQARQVSALAARIDAHRRPLYGNPPAAAAPADD